MKQDASLEVVEDKKNVLFLYVEWGWGMNQFDRVAIVRRAGFDSTEIEEVKEQDMTGNPGVHWFTHEPMLQPDKGDYICAFNLYPESSYVQVSVAVLPLSGWNDESGTFVRAYDNSGTFDYNNTMELHYFGPTHLLSTLHAGEKYRIRYLVAVSPPFEDSFDWVPSTEDLNNLFNPERE